MRRNVCNYLILVFMPFSSFIYGGELSDIAIFVNDVCDEIVTKGKRNVTKTELEASVEGKLGKIAKYIGLEVGADGKVVVSNSEEEYEGLPYDSLSEQMTDSRSCKRALSKQLIEERNKVTNKLESLFSDDLEFVEWPNTKELKFIIGTTTVEPSCPEDAGNEKSVIHIKIDGEIVDLKVNKVKFEAKLSTDRKTLLAKADIMEDGGITTSNAEIKLRSDGEIEGELPWVWKGKYGEICTGTDVITDIKKQASYR